MITDDPQAAGGPPPGEQAPRLATPRSERGPDSLGTSDVVLGRVGLRLGQAQVQLSSDKACCAQVDTLRLPASLRRKGVFLSMLAFPLDFHSRQVG